jgi:hypothetical protein
MLVGGGVGVFTGGDQNAAEGQARRYWGAAALVAALVSTLWVLSNASADNLSSWQTPLALIVLCCAVALAIVGNEPRVREAALLAGILALLVAPAIWSVATLGHATSSTFPAGGSASAAGSIGGPGGRPGVAAGGRMGGPPPGMPAQSGQGGFGGGSGQAPGAAAGPGGAMFGGQSTQLSAAITYAKSHGGGMIGVESQSSAGSYVAASGANIAGIGGFSGRESSVSIAWLAAAVADGRLRWFYTGSGGMGGCKRVQLGSPASTSTTSSATASSGFYDCAGKSAALKALAS